jgi:hypothetical protein
LDDFREQNIDEGNGAIQTASDDQVPGKQDRGDRMRVVVVALNAKVHIVSCKRNDIETRMISTALPATFSSESSFSGLEAVCAAISALSLASTVHAGLCRTDQGKVLPTDYWAV